jgi:hypothetical protein
MGWVVDDRPQEKDRYPLYRRLVRPRCGKSRPYRDSIQIWFRTWCKQFLCVTLVLPGKCRRRGHRPFVLAPSAEYLKLIGANLTFMWPCIPVLHTICGSSLLCTPDGHIDARNMLRWINFIVASSWIITLPTHRSNLIYTPDIVHPCL